MNFGLAFAFLFGAGAMLGWCIEFLYRNLISHSGPRGKYFINPGFCRGPWLPIYGIGVATMFFICYLVTDGDDVVSIWGIIGTILVITIIMTLIEFIGGVFLLKVMNLRLWDYRNEPGNIMGIICPKFTLIWGALGAAYFLLLHNVAIEALIWLSNNLAFSFFVGAFASAFIIDFAISAKDAMAIKQYGDANSIIIKYEELKDLVQKKAKELESNTFFAQAKTEDQTLKQVLDTFTEAHEDKAEAFKSNYKSRRARKKANQKAHEEAKKHE